GCWVGMSQPGWSTARMRSGAAVRVSLVIPTWQRVSWLDRCLAGVAAQDRLPSDVLVVGRAEDAPASTLTEQWARIAPFEVRWLEVETPGHVAPVRRGLTGAREDVVAFLDDDAEPEPGWLGTLLAPFGSPRVACVGGRVVTATSRGRV